MTLVGLIRHGRTDWNEAKRIQGHTDRPLSPRGRAEMGARRLPPELAEAVWFTSPLLRTRQTAALLGIADFTVDRRLIEMSFGGWEGHTLDFLRATDPKDVADNERRGLDFRAPGGESPRDVRARLRDWLEDSTVHGAVAAVTHNGVIRAAFSLALDWDMKGPPPVAPDWACAHLFRFDNGTLQPQRLNLPLPGSAG
jgi:broad specificity phosphatase PhoE